MKFLTLILTLIIAFMSCGLGGCVTVLEAPEPHNYEEWTYHESFFRGAITFSMKGQSTFFLMKDAKKLAFRENERSLKQWTENAVQERGAELGRRLYFDELLQEHGDAREKWAQYHNLPDEEEKRFQFYYNADANGDFHISREEAEKVYQSLLSETLDRISTRVKGE